MWYSGCFKEIEMINEFRVLDNNVCIFPPVNALGKGMNLVLFLPSVRKIVVQTGLSSLGNTTILRI